MAEYVFDAEYPGIVLPQLSVSIETWLVGNGVTQIVYTGALTPQDVAALEQAAAAYPAFIAAQQAAAEQAAVIKQAAEATMQSARNMVPFVPYFSALQYETRKSIVQRDDLVTHFGKLLMVLQSDQKMWGDFIHTLDLWHGLTEAEVLAQDVSDDVMHHVCFAAALFMTAGAASALFPLALKP